MQNIWKTFLIIQIFMKTHKNMLPLTFCSCFQVTYWLQLQIKLFSLQQRRATVQNMLFNYLYKKLKVVNNEPVKDIKGKDTILTGACRLTVSCVTSRIFRELFFSCITCRNVLSSSLTISKEFTLRNYFFFILKTFYNL